MHVSYRAVEWQSQSPKQSLPLKLTRGHRPPKPFPELVHLHLKSSRLSFLPAQLPLPQNTNRPGGPGVKIKLAGLGTCRVSQAKVLKRGEKEGSQRANSGQERPHEAAHEAADSGGGLRGGPFFCSRVPCFVAFPGSQKDDHFAVPNPKERRAKMVWFRDGLSPCSLAGEPKVNGLWTQASFLRRFAFLGTPKGKPGNPPLGAPYFDT